MVMGVVRMAMLLHAGRVEVLMRVGPSKGLTQALAFKTLVAHSRNWAYKNKKK
jgi:hypothetical protein